MTKANTHTRGRTETGIVFLLLVVVVVSTTVSADDQIRWLNSLRAGTGILTISMAHNSIHEKVYGRFNTMVHVYVPMHRASPTLYCRSWHMRHRDLPESTVIWIGPAGVLHNGRHTNITQDKGVMLKNAQAWMSGEYSCMITYNTLSGKKSHQLHFGFIVFVFRDPDVMYTMQVRYLTNNCRLSRNNQMMKTLQQEWNHQIRTLKSHITGLKSNCYHVDYPVLGPKNELNVSFTVNPYGNQWLEKCLKYPLPHCKIALNSRMEKVKNLFRQYFKEEKERLEDLHHLMLDFHYIGGSLKILEDLFCRPGFGINNVQHSTCFNCCVVCSPGEYSSTYEPYCKKCAHMGKEEYGAAYC